MKVLVQKNIWNEYGYDRFLASLRNAGVEVKEVNIIPFTTEIVDLDDFAPDYTFGSTRFITICREKGLPTFPPVPFGGGAFPFKYWLNNVGRIWTMEAIRKERFSFEYPTFIKPYDTEKFFTGVVLESPEDFDKLQLSTSFVEDPEQEKVFAAEYKKIEEEIRFFIIGGKVITASRYKIKGERVYKEITPPHPAWIQAEYLVKTFNPHQLNKGYVMDLGLVADQWKIIELNDMGSAGLYMCDTDNLTRALIANHGHTQNILELRKES